MRQLMLLCCLFVIAGCSSTPIVPSASYIKISRDNPSDKCENLGPVQGSVSSVKGTVEEAIEDMKLDAARKGGNYVRMETASGIGTSVRGTVYKCP